MRRLPAALFTLTFALAAAWGQERDVTLAEIRAAARAATPSDLARRGPGAFLAALAGVDGLPSGCGTPVLLDLRAGGEAEEDAALRLAADTLAARPDGGPFRSLVSRDGGFILHFPASDHGLMAVDGDRNGLPDPVDRANEALGAARSFLAERLGYPDPAGTAERIEVILADLGHGLEGLTVAAAGDARAPRPFVLIDAGLDLDRIAPAVVHQAAHLSLARLAAPAPAWWSEATAAFLTLQATGDLRGPAAALGARLQAAGRGLLADGLLLMQGALLWPEFLAERLADPGAVLRTWQEMAREGSDPLTAVDAVLRRSGLALADAHREFAAWNLFTGARDDGVHYAFGRDLPEAPLPAPGGAAVQISSAEGVEPLGSAAFRLPGDGRPGALDLTVQAQGGRPGADLLIADRGQGGGRVLVPVALDAQGYGRVAIPWGDVDDAWLILRNDGTPAVGPARFEVRGARDPYLPFDLAGLSAEAAHGAITLAWTTASERGLVGWNIERAESPDGPFRRLNAVAVPAYGDSTVEVGYLFVDDTARAGRRYYYRLEGITDLGLPARSHVASARLPAER